MSKQGGTFAKQYAHTHTRVKNNNCPVRDTHSYPVVKYFLSHTHLFPQVVHNPHDAGKLSVLLFGGTFPLALLLGA